MAETDQQMQQKSTAASGEATTDQPVYAAKQKTQLPKLPTVWWVAIAILAFFAVLGLCAAGFTTVRMLSGKNGHADITSSAIGDRNFTSQRSGNGTMQGGGMMGPRGDFNDSTDSSGTTRLNGVVTAVDGSTITVAGNGTTTKVVVNDTTTYTGDDKPAVVNDTIMVVGTKDGDTLTATRVVIQRQ